MPLPNNVLANADDFGLNNQVNKAILLCYSKGYINSTSLLTNTAGFEEAVQMIHQHSYVYNVGIHVNLAEGKPLTAVHSSILKPDGSWDLEKTGKASSFFSRMQKEALLTEIYAQIERALANKVLINHIDSHYHLHTLPGLHKLFLQAAQHYNLKLRLAQTYREGSFLKYWYRLYLNGRIRSAKSNYSDLFETVDHFLINWQNNRGTPNVEVMLHPAIDTNGNLTDHYDSATMIKWIDYLKQLRNN